ncbi:FtsH protease activity modulator HflK [Thiohalospira sp.]|uniref:FtsH protease activity modulator HflK n=1 Tax=Thiohalospira sp. TaxID=3080549 RepID=UPI00398161ED
MAWNEPGGSGGRDRDPWGSPSNDQGPPDLDEVIRKVRNRFRGLFGGGGSGGDDGGGGMNTPSASPKTFGLIAAAVVVVWALSGIYIIDEGKRGVVSQFGAYHGTVEPGPHWYPRFIQAVETVDIDQIRNVEIGAGSDESLVLTQDENIVDVKFSIQYRVGDPEDFVFNVREPDATLRQAAESAIREVIGKSTLDMVITTGRAEIAQQASERLQSSLDSYGAGLLVTNVNMQSAQPPDEVQDAFADAVKSREDQQRLINEAEVYANGIIPEARGTASRRIEEAEGYAQQRVAEAEGESDRFLAVLEEYEMAPEVTRERLYLETLEGVMSEVGKVMVDVDGSGNLMYLPLEKMMQGSSGGGSDGSSSDASGSGVPNLPSGNSDSSSGDSSPRNPTQQRSREVR